jgi:hypothetical protein
VERDEPRDGRRVAGVDRVEELLAEPADRRVGQGDRGMRRAGRQRRRLGDGVDREGGRDCESE